MFEGFLIDTLVSVDSYFGSVNGKLATFSTGGNFEY